MIEFRTQTKTYSRQDGDNRKILMGVEASGPHYGVSVAGTGADSAQNRYGRWYALFLYIDLICNVKDI